MNQGFNYGMPMPTPQYTARPPQQHHGTNQGMTNVNGFGGGRLLQPDVVVSKFSNTLQQADTSELQELHDSDEKIHKLLDENNEVKQLQAEREMQVAGNRSLAEYNLTLGPKLSSGKERLRELYEELNKQTVHFEENRRNLESLSGQYNPDTMLALMQTSVAQSEEISEKIADSFIDGDLGVEEFLEQYQKERTQVHARRTKVDKLKELMRGRR